MITAVGFDENGFRCAGELEHSCKQHSSKQIAGDIHGARYQSIKSNEFLNNEFGALNLYLKNC